MVSEEQNPVRGVVGQDFYVRCGKERRQIGRYSEAARGIPQGVNLARPQKIQRLMYIEPCRENIIRLRFMRDFVAIHFVGCGDSTHRCRRRRHDVIL